MNINTHVPSEELIALRKKADDLGVKYHHRAGVDKVQKAINAHTHAMAKQTLETSPEPAVAAIPTMDAAIQKEMPKPPPYKEPISEFEYKKMLQKEIGKSVGALIRVRIQCMNPAKKDWPGEIISTGSAKLGTFKKYIPFNSEPYHIPNIIYNVLKDKKCSIFINAVSDRGHKTRKSKLINEYAIEILEPLSKQELNELSRKQSLAAGTA